MSCHWRRLMGNEAKQTISVGEKRDGKRLRSGFYLQVISHAGILRSRRDGFEALKRGRGPDSSPSISAAQGSILFTLPVAGAISQRSRALTRWRSVQAVGNIWVIFH